MSDTETAASGARDIIETVERLSATTCLELPRGDTPFAVVVPDGKRLDSVKALADEWRTKPERIKANVHLHTACAFIDYVKRFTVPGASSVFVNGDIKSREMIAALDWHGEDGPKDASFATHKARHNFPLSLELQA